MSSYHRRPENRRCQLLFWRRKKAVLTIEGPSNGTKIPNDLTRIICTVAYREQSLLFKTIKRTSLLVDNKVVETRTKGFKRKGKVTFAMNVGNLTAGRSLVWHAEASVRPFFGLLPFFQSTEVSPMYTMTKEVTKDGNSTKEIPLPEAEMQIR
jgi:hypothetical protein